MGLEDREKNRENKMRQEVVKSMISTSEPQEEKPKEEKELVVIPTKEEPRSKRVNLLLQPSVHQKAQKKCKKMGISLNECINQLLSSWIQEE